MSKIAFERLCRNMRDMQGWTDAAELAVHLKCTTREVERAWASKGKKSKYNNKRMTLSDGSSAASTFEGNRKEYLLTLERAGAISGLCFEVWLPIVGSAGWRIDSVYREQTGDFKGRLVFEEQKGKEMAGYALKRAIIIEHATYPDSEPYTPIVRQYNYNKPMQEWALKREPFHCDIAARYEAHLCKKNT